jgi:hypothetical protein
LLLSAISCGGERTIGADSTTVIGDSPQGVPSLCAELGLAISGRASISPETEGCTIALRAFFALASDTATLAVLGPQSLSVSNAEIDELREQDLGSSEIRRVTSVTLRLPKASHDVQVRFGAAGNVLYVSTVHKPIQ